ncbi:hypothetical protein [Paenibacillus thiaminolyticus]
MQAYIHFYNYELVASKIKRLQSDGV